MFIGCSVEDSPPGLSSGEVNEECDSPGRFGGVMGPRVGRVGPAWFGLGRTLSVYGIDCQ